jgi:hypothetical protein
MASLASPTLQTEAESFLCLLLHVQASFSHVVSSLRKRETETPL